MEFSPVVPFDGKLLAICDSYIATMHAPRRIVIRSISSLRIKRVLVLEDMFASRVRDISWSSVEEGTDRFLLLTTDTEIKIMSVNGDTVFDIRASITGFRAAFWIGTLGDIGVIDESATTLTLWSIVTRTGTTLRANNLSPSRIANRRSTPTLAILARNVVDQIILAERRSDGNWVVCFSIELPTLQAQSCQWSDNGLYLFVQDCALDPALYIYTASGSLFRKISLNEQLSLGVRLVSWVPLQVNLAIPSFDGRVSITNIKKTLPTMHLNHNDIVKEGRHAVWQQKSSQNLCTYEQFLGDLTMSTGAQSRGARPIVDQLVFSHSGQFLATRLSCSENTVWIWAIPQMCLVAILIGKSTVRDLLWHGCETEILTFTSETSFECSSTSKLHMWCSDWSRPRIMPVPFPHFDITACHPIQREDQTGFWLLLQSKQHFVVGYTAFNNEDDESASDWDTGSHGQLHGEVRSGYSELLSVAS